MNMPINMQKPSIVVPALIGGVFLGITSALPLVNLINCACCALVIGGGVIASFLYIRDYPQQIAPVSYSDGAVLGMLTGVFGAFIWTAVDIPLAFLKLQFGLGMADLGELEAVLDDPSIPPVLRDIATQLFSGGGLSLGIVIFEFLINIIVAVIFATLGAIIGVALFQKQAYTPPMPGPGPQSPPPNTPGV